MFGHGHIEQAIEYGVTIHYPHVFLVCPCGQENILELIPRDVQKSEMGTPLVTSTHEVPGVLLAFSGSIKKMLFNCIILI